MPTPHSRMPSALAILLEGDPILSDGAPIFAEGESIL